MTHLLSPATHLVVLVIHSHRIVTIEGELSWIAAIFFTPSMHSELVPSCRYQRAMNFGLAL